MAKLRINGDSSGYVDLEAPNAASSSTLDLDQIPQKNATTTAFTGSVGIGETSPFAKLHVSNNQTGRTSADSVGNLLVLEDYENGMSILSANAGAGYILFGDQADTAAGAIAYDHSADRLRFRVNSSWDKMVINASGHVTTPQQPSFYAYPLGGSTASTASYTTPGLDNTSHNIGNHWNTSTVTFTAPVTGYYYFKFAIYWNSTNGYSRLRIEKNGTDINHYNIKPGLGGDHSQEVSGIVSMSANDTIKPEMQSDQSNSYFRAKNHTYFEGYLLG